ncbi:ADP-ribosylglycohydrolase family protein [Polymorphospora lycopeni]|uniref:ADP-ribosylglycohydrolase family protein n=1 Tax=Polymorphospora lycopeni TaxID=3140240 RepID=A0ABV5CJF5_9ACTN
MTMLDLCYDSLDGLSVGDALGAQFLLSGGVSVRSDWYLPEPPWRWTDDTEMACSIVDELREHAGIDQDRLAVRFAGRFDPYRGYGGGTAVLLRQLQEGVTWQAAAGAAFGGRGSMGNGAAMRVAPLGAFHAGDSRTAALQAMRSAQVTHTHPEAVLGAVAVAVAAAEAGWARLTRHRPDPHELFEVVLAHLIDSRVRTGIVRAGRLRGVGVAEAAYELGNGSKILAFDTVPFALWVAATRIDDYPAAIRACVEAGGDVDTTAAIVGGIVGSYTGVGPGGIPAGWLEHREPLPGVLPPAT